MAQQHINLGTPNGDNGDFVRNAFAKTEDNFNEVYSLLNNKPVLQSIILPEFSLEFAANAINNLPPFTVLEDQIQYIYASVSTGLGQDVRIYCLTFRNIGVGTYGIGGTTITKDNLLLISDVPVTSDTITDLPTTQRIHLGNGGSDTIDVIFNNHTFTGSESPVQHQNEGYVLVDVTINGEALEYLFTGIGGNYGIGGTETATINDFTLLTNIEYLQSTEFIELGEIGNSLVEDILNNHNPCIIIQDQTDGYTIVNTTVSGQLVQYLFVGSAGSYGSGCTHTAVELDFTPFAPPIPPAEISDLFHVVRSRSGADTGVKATAYNQHIIHGGDIHTTGRMLVGGGSNNGLGNTGTSWLTIVGNQGTNFRTGNANSGRFDFWQGNIQVYDAKRTRWNAKFSRDYNDRIVDHHNNYYRHHIGVEISDNVDLEGKSASSIYSALYIDSKFASGETRKMYSILSQAGDVEFNNGLLKLGSYNSTMTVGSTALHGLGVDNDGNVVKTPLSGGSGGTTLEVYTESGTLAGGDAVAKIGDIDTSSFPTVTGSGFYYGQQYEDAFIKGYAVDIISSGKEVSLWTVNSKIVLSNIDNSIKLFLDYYALTEARTQSFQDKSGTIALLPTSKGTAGQFLQTDGNDNVVWATPSGVNSTTTGEPTGSDKVINIISLTQAEYDLGPISPTTFYIITDA